MTDKEPKKYELKDLPKVGQTTIDKLNGVGIFEVSNVAIMSVDALASASGMGKKASMDVIKAAIKMCGGDGFIDASELLTKRRDNLFYVSTGSQAIDDLLGGKGLEAGSMSQVFGRDGSSKTQVALTMAVMAQNPLKVETYEEKEEVIVDGKKGYIINEKFKMVPYLNDDEPRGKVIWMDTEDTFKPERIMEIAGNRGLNPEETLKNIFVKPVLDVDRQFLALDEIEQIVRADSSFKMIVIDSLINHFRADGGARGQLADRQKLINTFVHRLQRIALTNNLLVYYTNQIMSDPAAMFGPGDKRVGGNVMNHNANFIIEVKKPSSQISKNDRIAKLVKSPVYPDGEALYYIGPQGACDDVKDIVEYKKKVIFYEDENLGGDLDDDFNNTADN